MMIYLYEIRRENAVNGKQSEFVEQYQSDKPLTLGKLYFVLPERSGAYRVLKLIDHFES